jgi:hypothetical protein
VVVARNHNPHRLRRRCETCIRLGVLVVHDYYRVRVFLPSLSFCKVCVGYTVSKRGDDVLIRCPGMKDPWMIIVHCLNPKVARSGLDITITCGG